MDILCCRITIGDADPSNPMRIQNGVEITEVQSLEINESYKKLIGTAKVIFPKGSVCRSTIIGNVTLEGKDVSRITTEVMQDGVIIEKRSAQRLVDETTFKVGQRINIKLGYNGVLKNMFDGYITGYNSDSTLEIQCENMAYKLKLKQAPHFETPAERYAVSTAAPMLSIPIIYTKSTGMNRWSTPMRSTSAGVPVISVPEPRLSRIRSIRLLTNCRRPSR